MIFICQSNSRWTADTNSWIVGVFSFSGLFNIIIIMEFHYKRWISRPNNDKLLSSYRIYIVFDDVCFLPELRWIFISEAKCEWSLKQSSLTMQCTQIKWMNGWTFPHLSYFCSFQNSASFFSIHLCTRLCLYWYRLQLMNMTMALLCYLIFTRGSLILWKKSFKSGWWERFVLRGWQTSHYCNWETLSDCHKMN